MMFRKAMLAMILPAGLAAFAVGEVVEEETWYDADGKVVKTVKRTLTGAEARGASDWEPQWVVRENARGTRTARRYSSSSRYGRSYGYQPYWGGGYYYAAPRYYHCGSRVRPGFTGYYRGGSGGSRWGLSYRSPGLSIRYCR